LDLGFDGVSGFGDVSFRIAKHVEVRGGQVGAVVWVGNTFPPPGLPVALCAVYGLALWCSSRSPRTCKCEARPS
jgi:hypothetical protein